MIEPSKQSKKTSTVVLKVTIGVDDVKKNVEAIPSKISQK
jgi:hypothetical protein